MATQTLSWALTRTGNGWTGTVQLPAGMKAAGVAPTKAGAMRRATALAQAALANPLLSSVIPPQAKMALKAASILAKNPVARKAWRALKSTGLKKFAKALF